MPKIETVRGIENLKDLVNDTGFATLHAPQTSWDKTTGPASILASDPRLPRTFRRLSRARSGVGYYTHFCKARSRQTFPGADRGTTIRNTPPYQTAARRL
jgi:hypothetical protein